MGNFSDTDFCRFVAALMVREYLFEHPGTAFGPLEERVYSDGFRDFVVSLKAPGQPCGWMSIEDMALVTGVDSFTLEEWLHFLQ